MSRVRPSSVLIAAFIVATAGPLGDAAAQATTGSMFGGGVVAPVAGPVAVGDTSTSGTSSIPSDITITGEPDQASPSEAVTLDGQYIIAAGGSRQSAVLGAITFDPTGTVVTGTISIISAAAASTSSSVSLTTDATAGSDVVPVAPAPSASATVTDCTATGGSYSLETSGAGEARLDLDCGGSDSTVTWRLFVTATDGLTQAQQVRAVQLEPLGTTGDDGIIDLTLTRQ